MSPFHVILAAFGSTRNTEAVKAEILRHFESRFPSAILHWTTASRFVRRHAEEAHPSPEATLRALRDSPHPVIVQSLHVTCGSEFHRLVRECRAIVPEIPVGRPLLASPADCEAVATILTAEGTASERAEVLVAHGTRHPAGIYYHQVGGRFASLLGDRGFFGMMEGTPDRHAVGKAIATAGFRKARLVPLTLVTGFHFNRDLVRLEDSWKAVLEENGIDVDVEPRGLGLRKETLDLFCDHLEAEVAGLTP